MGSLHRGNGKQSAVERGPKLAQLVGIDAGVGKPLHELLGLLRDRQRRDAGRIECGLLPQRPTVEENAAFERAQEIRRLEAGLNREAIGLSRSCFQRAM